MNPVLSSFMGMILLLLIPVLAAAADVGTTGGFSGGGIGVIIDNSSRIGKEELVAMRLAIQDFKNKTNQQLDLHVRDSNGDPVLAVFSGKKNFTNLSFCFIHIF